MADNIFKAGDTISTELKIHGVLYEIQADVLYDDEPDRLYQHIFITPRRVLTKPASGTSQGTWEDWNTDEDVQTSFAVERKAVWRIPAPQQYGPERPPTGPTAKTKKDGPEGVQLAAALGPQKDEGKDATEATTGNDDSLPKEEENARQGKRASV
ncbi:hypothetical protein MAPG_08737 [Magnaporthiopsis poae ATCC 64411]|uniref:Uncharacterized protein n=1 Tax=Magnaporthiopsis poae (strain ATCC 64411 / 73-15) TaxID=644358 RepID=A0A0C4E849_MAGP6|nr:hypothetical protein MAPG_08737 [Magnaporthiopsis poae ATCC 64411]